MSQRVPNIVASFKNVEADPAQTPNSGISGIVAGTIVLRSEVDGPSGIEPMTPAMIVTPSITVT